MAQAQEIDSSPPEQITEPEGVGGLDIPADGESVQSVRPKKQGYITDPLFIGRLSEGALLQILEQEVRKMKQSPPTPEELVVTESQGKAIETAFADFREDLRKYNNEINLKMVGLRKLSGLGSKAPETLEEDKDFSPMLYINPLLIEPSGVGEDAIKVDKLTVEQNEARDEMRALILAGPLVEELELVVMGVLENEQGEVLAQRMQEIIAKRVKSQKARELTKRTGVLKIEDLSENSQKRLAEMEPRRRAAALERIRMTMISGGYLELKKHRKKLREKTMRDWEEREEKARQKQADQKKLENPEEG